MSDLSEDAHALTALRAEADEAKAISDALSKQFKLAQAQLIERMKDEGIKGLKTEEYNLTPASTVYARVTDREKFVKWAHDHDTGLIEEKERAANINQLVREYLDNNTPLPPGLSFYEKEYLSQRSA